MLSHIPVFLLAVGIANAAYPDACPYDMQISEAQTLLSCSRSSLMEAKVSAFNALRICPVASQRDYLVEMTTESLRQSGNLFEMSNKVLQHRDETSKKEKCGILRPRVRRPCSCGCSCACSDPCACGVKDIELEDQFAKAIALLDRANVLLCRLSEHPSDEECIQYLSEYETTTCAYEKVIENFLYILAMFNRPPFRDADEPICRP